MSNIKCVRLTGGEEIMGDVVQLGDGEIHIEDPAAIHMMPNQSGQMQLGMLPWLPYSDDRKFVIATDKVVTVHTPSRDLLNRYNSIFGSGIEIAPAGSI